jgi:hypothetical protein
METAIKIGCEVSKETGEQVRKMVETIFRVGYQTHMDQDTIRAALASMASAVSVNGTIFNGASVIGDKTINVE